MNWQSMLLVGLLLGSSIASDVNNYERIYTEDYEQEQVEENPKDIVTLIELAEYYEEKDKEDPWGWEYFSELEAVYKQIIEVNPESTKLAELYLSRAHGGNLYRVDEKDDGIFLYKKAEAECLRVFEFNDDNIQIKIDLGEMYSEIYYPPIYRYDYADSEFFEQSEKMYFDALRIDENNNYVRYKLIELYEGEWDIFKRSDYKGGKENKDFSDKIEEQLLEISKIQSNEELSPEIMVGLAEIFKDIWYESEYTDNEAFGKAEYYYKYALNIEPDNGWALYKLSNLYEDGYRYGNANNKENFGKAEQLYKQYPDGVNEIYLSNTHFCLANLYKYKWLEDKSDYTYYYMAKNELHDALDVELKLESEDSFSMIDPFCVAMSLAELTIDKYEFDGDVEDCNDVKNILLEQISNFYAESGDDSYFDIERLENLGIGYYYVWRLDTDDIQYYEKAEKTFLELLDSSPYYTLLLLGELYTERWLVDKSDVEYKLKAIECFDKIFAYENELSGDFWFQEDVYSLLEKLEL